MTCFHPRTPQEYDAPDVVLDDYYSYEDDSDYYSYDYDAGDILELYTYEDFSSDEGDNSLRNSWTPGEKEGGRGNKNSRDYYSNYLPATPSPSPPPLPSPSPAAVRHRGKIQRPSSATDGQGPTSSYRRLPTPRPRRPPAPVGRRGTLAIGRRRRSLNFPAVSDSGWRRRGKRRRGGRGSGREIIAVIVPRVLIPTPAFFFPGSPAVSQRIIAFVGRVILVGVELQDVPGVVVVRVVLGVVFVGVVVVQDHVGGVVFLRSSIEAYEKFRDSIFSQRKCGRSLLPYGRRRISVSRWRRPGRSSSCCGRRHDRFSCRCSGGGGRGNGREVVGYKCWARWLRGLEGIVGHGGRTGYLWAQQIVMHLCASYYH